MAERYTAVSWSTTELLADVRREAKMPDSEVTDAEILAEASSAIWTDLQEILVVSQAMSGWGLTYEDQLASAAYGDGDQFRLPAYGSAETISHVHWYDSSTDTDYIRLDPIPAQLIADYQADSGANPEYYYLEAGRIRVVPSPGSGSTGKLRVWYQARHPELVVTTANIATVDGQGTDTLEFAASRPANWPATTGYAVDVYSKYMPYRYYYRGLVVTAHGAADEVGYTAANEDTTAIGDIPTDSTVFVALAGQSDQVMLPIEFRKPLAQKVAAYLLRQQGDETGANSLEGMYMNALARVRAQLVPRTKGQSQRWINRNSPLRRTARRRWRW